MMFWQPTVYAREEDEKRVGGLVGLDHTHDTDEQDPDEHGSKTATGDVTAPESVHGGDHGEDGDELDGVGDAGDGEGVVEPRGGEEVRRVGVELGGSARFAWGQRIGADWMYAAPW